MLKFTYTGLIFNDRNGVITELSSLNNIHEPQIENNVHLSNDQFNVTATLKRVDEGIFRSLYNDGDKELVWNCHHPKAVAEIQFRDVLYKGTGYAETLYCTMKPWQLPIDELRWGRFLSDSYTIIWINWLGKNPLNLLFFNNREINDAVLANDNIVFAGGEYLLKFSDKQVIRKGKLSHLFDTWPFIKVLFNPRLLGIIETKFKAKTELLRNSELLSDGWSIFEIVIWGK
jgi:hypothetical protein